MRCANAPGKGCAVVTNQFERTLQIHADNPPLPRAGAYLLRHVASGKSYVGISINIRRRSREHVRGEHSPKLHRAIRKHGIAAFEFVPLAYLVPDAAPSILPQIEADLIVQFDAVRRGYNIQERSGGIGPYGSEHARAVSAAVGTPEARRRKSIVMRTVLSSPAMRKRLSDSAKARVSTPEARAALAARFGKSPEDEIKRRRAAAIANATERAKEAHRSAVRTFARSPEGRAQRSQQMKDYWSRSRDDPVLHARLQEQRRQAVLKRWSRRVSAV